MRKLGNKILLMLLTLLLISMAILILLNSLTFQAEFVKLQTEVSTIAEDSIGIINVDLFEKALLEGNMESEAYKEIQQAMILYKNDINVKYFYTMYTENEKAYYAVDSSLIDPSEFGDEEEDANKALLNSFNGQVNYTEEPVTDHYGTFISAYAPIKNASGETIGILGVDKDVVNFVQIRDTLNTYIWIASAFILVLSSIASYFFSKGITRKVKIIQNTLINLSQGDLTVKAQVSGKDEFQKISQVINIVSERFKDSIQRVRETSEGVMDDSENLSALSQEMAATSKEVSSAVENVASRTEEQAEEFEKINAIITGFGGKIGEVTGIVMDLHGRMGNISSRAKDSNSTLESLNHSLNDVVLSFKKVSEKINSFDDQLTKISDISNIINNIADQTNMIALNASIEAARAGDLGRGFAVVADEIRKLAEQSKDSSANINSLLQGLSQESSEVTEISGTMNTKLSKEIKAITQSMDAFKGIILSMEEIFPRIGVINDNIHTIDNEKDYVIKSLGAVTEKLEEISAAAEEISASSQDSSNSSQEVATASQNLIGKAQVMVESIHQFKV